MTSVQMDDLQLGKVLSLFRKDNFAKGCGIEIEEVTPGFARCSMKVSTNHLNGLGILMGGALFTLADYTFSLAANSYGKIAVTQNASIAYRRKCSGGVVTAIATETGRDERTGDYVVEVSNDQNQVIARIKGTAFYTGASI